MRTRTRLLIGPVVLAAAVMIAPAALAAADHTVTFVNGTGETVWIGSTVNADGSVNFTGLPTLAPSESATVVVPESADPGHWRGKFFARQGCTGTDGAEFHCAVGDCGTHADRCDTGEQPVSLAEFNFDPADSLAPWYDVSYVNAFSVPVTIDADNASPPPGSTSCAQAGCADDLLPFCPADNLQTWPDGSAMNCVSPNRDAKTPYSDAIESHCPKAYAWSKQDTEPGNQVMYQCTSCSGFTVTFH